MIKKPFGENFRGEPVVRYTLSNNNGMSLSVMNHGATLLSLIHTDARGQQRDVVLGHDTAAEYDENSAYFGSVVGRYANRICDAKFVLNGKTYSLVANDGKNTLHGGARGFDCVLWQEGSDCRHNQIELVHTSRDGDQGFPGEVNVSVRYHLTNDNTLRIEYTARTTSDTPLNLTHHAYFNLCGHNAGDCLGHVLTVDAEEYLPVDPSLIPTGVRSSVIGSAFDFRTPRPIGEWIRADDEQIRRAGGYDHTFVLMPSPGDDLRQVARMVEPVSGRGMIVSTTEPGVQVYSGNQLHPGLVGKGGFPYARHGGVCLETQHFPDSPNQPDFPDTLLTAGETFHSVTEYTFFNTKEG